MATAGKEASKVSFGQVGQVMLGRKETLEACTSCLTVKVVKSGKEPKVSRLAHPLQERWGEKSRKAKPTKSVMVKRPSEVNPQNSRKITQSEQ